VGSTNQSVAFLQGYQCHSAMLHSCLPVPLAEFQGQGPGSRPRVGESLHQGAARKENLTLGRNQNLAREKSGNDLRSKDLEPISSSVSSRSEQRPVGTNSGSPRKTSATVLHCFRVSTAYAPGKNATYRQRAIYIEQVNRFSLYRLLCHYI
jgi:hypothetical protein